jgi:N-acetylneuraminic acid mutarotase
LGHINSVSNELFEDFWQYNPASNVWTQIADFGGGLRYHSYGFTVGDKAYVGTGRAPGGIYETDNWEYSPATNTWTERASFPGVARRGAVAFVVDDIGYVGSGETFIPGSNDFYGYDPLTDSWNQVQSFPGQERTSAVGFAIQNKGYFGTGELLISTPLVSIGKNDFWEYDPSSNVWTQKANVGDSVRKEACGFALSGLGYIGTGRNSNINDDTDDFWEYSPANDTWVEVEDFLGISRRYMVAFVIANKAYVGIGTNGTNFNDLWEYNPVYSPGMIPFQGVNAFINNDPALGASIGFNGLPSEVDGLDLLISDYDGNVIQRSEVKSSQVQLGLKKSMKSETYIYRLVKDEQVVKSGKINI